MTFSPSTTDTQPTLRVRIPPPPPRRTGCRSRLLWLVFAAIVIPIFLCGMTLVFYLVFPPPQMNVLILGVDGRGTEGFLSRTDSIMVLGVKPSQVRVSLLSIPRDLFIDAPGFGSQRINTISLLGEQQQSGSGPALLSQSIANTFGIGVNRYIRLDFQGFVDLIDAVGGVTIDVERVIVDDLYPTEDGGVISVRFDSGVQEMDGERALIYARTRHSDDDYQRASRQQQVVSALLAKLANPVRWSVALRVLGKNVDTNLNLIDLITLAPPVILNRGRFEQFVINRDSIVGSPDGHALPNLERITPWLMEGFK